MKYCRKCKLEKSESDFYFDKRRSAIQGPCKKCRISAASNDWRKANPLKRKESNFKTKLKTKYGLTLEGLIKLWEKQNKACAICLRPISLNAKEKASKPHVDHCHVSGVVRGLLCLTCNTGLGMFGDSLDLLETAKQYLSRGASTVKGHTVPASVSADSQFSETIH